jgi:hypothetical protein
MKHPKKEVKRWTREEVRQLKRLYSSTDTKEIARKIGRTEIAVNSKANSIWLKKNKLPNIKIKEFSHLFPRVTKKELAKRFKCSISYINSIAERFCLKKIKTGEWLKEDEQKLKKLYPDTPIQDLVRLFNRPKDKIISKANRLGLKTKRPERKEWSHEDIKLLKRLYPYTKNKILAERFACSFDAIAGQAAAYGLKKNRKQLTQKE